MIELAIINVNKFIIINKKYEDTWVNVNVVCDLSTLSLLSTM